MPDPPAPRPARSPGIALAAVLCALAALAGSGCRQKERAPSVDAAASVSPSGGTALASAPYASVASPGSSVLDVPLAPPRRPRGGLDVTFLVASDPHFGFGRPIDDDSPIDRNAPVGIEIVHDVTIRQMKALPARNWPVGLGGKVGRPRGLIMAGDLTEDGSLTQWKRFLAWYGERSDDRNLGIPLYETIGNHDRIRGDVIAKEVEKRHGAEFYSWDWDDLHVAVLGEAPNDRSLAWLDQDLRRAGPWVPVVLVLHYALSGPFSVREWKGDGGPYDRLRVALDGYRVVGIFHGHYHASGSYLWNGLDVYRVGSPKYVHHSFAVVRVTDEKLHVALWNTDARGWWWWHSKRIDRERDRGMMQIVPLDDIEPPDMAR